MIPIQTDIDTLIEPEFLTQELAILLGVVIIATLYAGIKLRSMFIVVGWMFMIVALVITFITDFPFIWFWIMVLVEVITIALGSIEYTRVSARGKD